MHIWNKDFRNAIESFFYWKWGCKLLVIDELVYNKLYNQFINIMHIITAEIESVKSVTILPSWIFYLLGYIRESYLYV